MTAAAAGVGGEGAEQPGQEQLEGTVWTADPGVARLEVLGAQQGVTDYSIRPAVLGAIHDAAYAGAYKIVTTSTDRTHPDRAGIRQPRPRTTSTRCAGHAMTG